MLKTMLNQPHFARSSNPLLLSALQNKSTLAGVANTHSFDILAMLYAGDINEWQQCIQLNLLGPMALTHAFSPGMVERKVCTCSASLR